MPRSSLEVAAIAANMEKKCNLEIAMLQNFIFRVEDIVLPPGYSVDPFCRRIIIEPTIQFR
jgi:hypothetical protein